MKIEDKIDKYLVGEGMFNMNTLKNIKFSITGANGQEKKAIRDVERMLNNVDDNNDIGPIMDYISELDDVSGKSKSYMSSLILQKLFDMDKEKPGSVPTSRVRQIHSDIDVFGAY